MMILFLKALIIGFAIAAPVGPIGILCIQRSLHDGFKIGLFTGLGAALADGTYGLIAGLSLTAVSNLLITYEFWIRLFGGIFLLYLGIKLILTKPREQTINVIEKSPWHALVTTYFLTLANPATLISFIAIFAGLGLSTTSLNHTHAIIFVLGITLGSAMWWLLLSIVVAYILHHMLSKSVMQKINRFSGVIILAFACLILSMQNF
jgi:threonine/homoserine/homoserine lactone efflux protein